MKKRDIEFLYEIGTLRFIQRTWQQFISPSFANLAEHILRVTWVAVIIAKNEENVDMEKLIKMAIVHDISESRTGDVNYLSRQYVKRDDNLAIRDILKDTSLEEEYLKLWEEYEKRDSIEAKIVKDADNIDVDLELKEQKAQGNEVYNKWHDMREEGMVNKLYTQTAKKIWEMLKESDPHDWHIKARNRFNDGDWKN